MGAECDEQPVADGGEGTIDVLDGERRFADVHDAFGRERRAEWLLLADGTAVVEAAQAIPLDPARLDVRAASSRGLGELIAQVDDARALVVGLGGTANMDAGAGLLEVLRRATAADAGRLRRADEARRRAAAVRAAEGSDARRRRRARARVRRTPARRDPRLRRSRRARARRSRRSAPSSCPARSSCSTWSASIPSGYDLVVTGEGTVDETTFEGKAPAVVQRRSRARGGALRAVRRPRARGRGGTHSRATRTGPMWISLSWVCGSVGATPRH